jgi:hypothetical protein
VTQALAWEAVAEAEALGVRFRLDGDRVRARLPDDEQGRLAAVLKRLRENRDGVAELLRRRASVPPFPPGVSLVEWNPKQPPIAIETCAVVVDVHLFISSTLLQLDAALTHRKRWVGWSVAQLVDRLRQVGVVVKVTEPLS